MASGIKNIPPNKYACVDATVCRIRQGAFGTNYSFPPVSCIKRECTDCGKIRLKDVLEDSNRDLLMLNKNITWHRWQIVKSRTVPQKLEIKGTLKLALNEFVDTIDGIAVHLFCANWNRNIFQYVKGHLQTGYLLQVMDFAMNFANRYQDEIQSAYYGGTQTIIHGTLNFFKCTNGDCNELVTLALVHISDDLKHDSFLSLAAMNMTFRYLVEVAGIPLDVVIQFCDNCALQYKSRRPFVEISRCALNLI